MVIWASPNRALVAASRSQRVTQPASQACNEACEEVDLSEVALVLVGTQRKSATSNGKAGGFLVKLAKGTSYSLFKPRNGSCAPEGGRC